MEIYYGGRANGKTMKGNSIVSRKTNANNMLEL